MPPPTPVPSMPSAQTGMGSILPIPCQGSGRPVHFPRRPRGGQGWPEATQLGAGPYLVAHLPRPGRRPLPPDSPGSAELVMRPKNTRRKGELEGALLPQATPPCAHPWQGMFSGASAASIHHVATNGFRGLPMPHTCVHTPWAHVAPEPPAAAVPGLPGRREQPWPSCWRSQEFAPNVNSELF